jgi:hypothetical protein
VKSEQKLVGFFFEKIDQYDMITELREIPEGTPAYISGLRVVERGNRMRNINDIESGVNLKWPSPHQRDNPGDRYRKALVRHR